MCGRFTITQDPDKLARRFGIDIGGEPWEPHYNAAPTQNLPVILNEDPTHMQFLRWGLVPAWARDPAIGNRMINARAESLLEKPSFRGILRRRRCLVLADGFYEWKKTGKVKVPMRIVVGECEPFAMAGLWDTWRDPGGNVLKTFTIITTQPNELLADIHNRMPALLKPEDEDIWMSNKAGVDDWLAVLRPYPADRMRAYAVSTRVNSAGDDEASMIEPAA